METNFSFFFSHLFLLFLPLSLPFSPFYHFLLSFSLFPALSHQVLSEDTSPVQRLQPPQWSPGWSPSYIVILFRLHLLQVLSFSVFQPILVLLRFGLIQIQSTSSIKFSLCGGRSSVSSWTEERRAGPRARPSCCDTELQTLLNTRQTARLQIP